MKTATILLAAATLCCMSVSAQVSTMEFDVPIHQMRIYDDVLYVSSDHAISRYQLSENGGFTPYLDADVVVYDFVMYDGRLLEAGTPEEHFVQHPARPWQLFQSAPLPQQVMGYQLRKSANFGGIWWSTGQELQVPGRPQFAFNPRNDDEMLVYGMNEYVDCICPFLLHSTDGLATFESVDMAFDREMTAIYQIAFSPTEDNVLVAATTNGMARSEDGGATWTFTTPELQPPFTQLCFDDMHPNVVFATQVGELPTCICDEVEQVYIVHCSADGGKTWRAIAAFGTPLTYDQSPKPWRHTGCLQGLTCHYGNLYGWADEYIFMVQSPLNLSPIINDIKPVVSGSDSTVYSLQGYKAAQPQTHGIYIRNNKKYAAK